MNLHAEGVIASRQKFAILKDGADRERVFQCDDCSFSKTSTRFISICPECQGETRIAPHSRQK